MTPALVKIMGVHKRERESGRETAVENPVRTAVVLAASGERGISSARLRTALSNPEDTGTQDGPLVDQTLRRLGRLIPPDRVITIVNPATFRDDDASRELGRRPDETVVLEPQDKGSASALLLALTYLRRRHGDVLTAVFPVDDAPPDDGELMAHVDMALRYVEQHPAKMVILGVEPKRPEPDFGYIVPAASLIGAERPVVGVSRFVEKPSRRAAADLIRQGALWSTSILVFRSATLLDFLWRTAPLLPLAFSEIAEAADTPRQSQVIRAVYEDLPPVDVARGVLELVAAQWPSSLAVLRVGDTTWSHRGDLSLRDEVWRPQQAGSGSRSR